MNGDGLNVSPGRGNSRGIRANRGFYFTTRVVPNLKRIPAGGWTGQILHKLLKFKLFFLGEAQVTVFFQ
jgi:hypothetical protein